jgi:hypothetical protein
MDHREKHQQHKQKEREQKKKVDKAYEDASEKRRLPVNSAWLVVAGVLLTVLIVYAWTFGMARPW